MNDFNRDNNRAVWFDIPVADLERATAFPPVTSTSG